MNGHRLFYPIALTMVPGIGSIHAKKLIAYVGSIEGIFNEKKTALLKIPGIGNLLADEIMNSNVQKQAEQELEFIDKYQIKPYFYLDNDYPARLKHCVDAPIMLYQKGNCNLDNAKVINIVGTRNATDYGKSFCDKLLQNISESNHKPLIVSGLAYGIDIAAHKSALKYGLETVAVLAHGLHTIYPAAHKKYARDIVNHGALVTEFTSNTFADKSFFIRRNRIIAGLSDATIVVESGEKGGALVTADIANSYNRDVFAVPGRIDDAASKGCNKLIKANKANLLETIDDIEYILGWEKPDNKPRVIQKELFISRSDEEIKILDILQKTDGMMLDILALEADLPVSKVSPLLLNLEFAGLVRSLPGKIYKVI